MIGDQADAVHAKMVEAGMQVPLSDTPSSTDEFPYLAEQLGPSAELVEGRVWVGECDGDLIGVLPFACVGIRNHSMLLPAAKNIPDYKSRTMLLLYLACEEYIKDPARNKVAHGFYSGNEVKDVTIDGVSDLAGFVVSRALCLHKALPKL